MGSRKNKKNEKGVCYMINVNEKNEAEIKNAEDRFFEEMEIAEKSIIEEGMITSEELRKSLGIYFIN